MIVALWPVLDITQDLEGGIRKFFLCCGRVVEEEEGTGLNSRCRLASCFM